MVEASKVDGDLNLKHIYLCLVSALYIEILDRVAGPST
jgi:hypothetical protein